MVGLMLMTVNERERQILTLAFNQLGVKITQSDPSYSNYVKALQYQPDVVVMELPRLNTDQIHFSGLIRKNKKTRKIPIVAYGDKIDEAQKRFMTQNGINNYLDRPLKFSMLMDIIQKYLKIFNKSIDAAGSDTASEKEGDIKLILDENTLPTKKIELMVKHISGMMAFPFTVAKVLRLADSEKSGAGDLSKVIEADPVISTSILKVSNTVFFASLNRRIGTIKDAIVRIGFRETKKIVMTMSVMELFGKEENSFGFNKMKFWIHSLATALISERMAKRMGDVSTDEAFLAGLLHDFGILMYDEFFPTIFEKILEATTNNGSRFIDNERSILKITRNDIIKELFTEWKLPESITEAVCSHYTICDKKKKPETANEKIALSTYMGNVLAKAFCFGRVCDEYITPIENSYFENIKMATGIGKDFYEAIEQDVNTYQKFLNIDDDPKEPLRDKKEIGIFCPANTLFNPVEEYFKAQGQSITRIQKSSTYTDYDQKFDAIFVWANAKTKLDAIIPLTSMIQRTGEPIDGAQEPPLAPVCAVVYNDSPIAAEETEKISLMYNEFDLRQLDDNLSQMLDGKIIKLSDSGFTPEAPPSSDDQEPSAPDPEAVESVE